MKVSVLVITYNHAAFIRQALDSVLMQRGQFRFEILISEDASIDGTREIVVGYEQQFPDQIRLLLSGNNLQSNAVVSRGIEVARGDYIALLDGDDYWLSPEKLQKQVTFLDTHPECAICFHNARVHEESGAKPDWNWTPPNHPELSGLADLWLGNFIATCSTMFRRGLVKSIPAWYNDFFPITDWPLHILNAEQGSIGYINDVLGLYRYHRGGYYSSLSERQKLRATLGFYQKINRCLNYRYDSAVKSAISKYFIEWVEEYLRRGDFPSARFCYRQFLRAKPINRFVSARRMLSNGMKAFLPRRFVPTVHSQFTPTEHSRL